MNDERHCSLRTPHALGKRDCFGYGGNMRRYKGHMRGEQYLGNANPSKMEVHDLDNERSQCQIDVIIQHGHDRPYTTLSSARAAGFDNCAYCLGNSTR